MEKGSWLSGQVQVELSWQAYSRGAPFDPFYFKLNDETLPIEL